MKRQKQIIMKQKLKKTTFALGFILLLAGCQVEEFQRSGDLNSSQITITEITQKDISPEIMSNLNKLESLTKKGKSKTVYDSINNFSIELEYGKYLTKGDYHSYTFKITRFVENNLLENLVVSLKPDGTYKTTIVSYNLTPEERIKLENKEFVDLVNKTSITVINNFKSSSIFKRETEIIVGSDGTCWTPTYGYSQGTGWETVVSYEQVSCTIDGSGGSPSGGPIPTSPDPSNSSGGNTIGTGVVTSPVAGGGTGNSNRADIRKFVNSLNFDVQESFSWLSGEAQNSIFNYLFANNYNEETTAKVRSYLNSFDYFWISQQPTGADVPIFNYLVQNGFSSESGSYIDSSIARMSQNPAIFTSIIPFLTEKQIDDSQLDPCPKGVMEQLKNTTNADIANVLAKLGANRLYTVNIVMKPAATYAETQRISKYNYIIRVDRERSTNGTKLYKATALIHEIIHAYFLSIVDDYNNTPSTVLPSFAELFEIYVKKEYPSSTEKQDAQHLAMANKYVDAMASALQEYDANYTVPFQVYKDLAWGGLSAAPIFDKTFPPGSADNIRILNRYRAESSGHAVEQGTPNAQSPVGKSCS